MAAATQRFGIVAALTMGLLQSSGVSAGHDSVPDPPPPSVNSKLQALPNLDRAAITVSGLSSGAFFAHQFHIAHSSLVNGAGLIAGGPFGCAESVPNPYWPFWRIRLDRVSAAVVACTYYFGDRYYGLPTAAPKAADSLRLIEDARKRQLIDDPENLRNDRVWLFRGRRDQIVPQAVFDALFDTYRFLGLKEPQLASDGNHAGLSASHGIPVVRFDGQSRFPRRACDQHAPPFLIQCDFDAAGVLLRHLYPDDFRYGSKDPHQDGTVVPFDQSEFFDSDDASLHRVAYLYVPAQCSQVQCRLHVAFHGCKQDLLSVHDDFVRDAGYNHYAATNRVVVLYPQATVSASNPNACWDFWGYTGLDYYTRTGAQMRAVKAMVDRVLGP